MEKEDLIQKKMDDIRTIEVEEWFKISGKGLVASVRDGRGVKPGDKVILDHDPYEVRAVEMIGTTNPARGLVVKLITPEQVKAQALGKQKKKEDLIQKKMDAYLDEDTVNQGELYLLQSDNLEKILLSQLRKIVGLEVRIEELEGR